MNVRRLILSMTVLLVLISPLTPVRAPIAAKADAPAAPKLTAQAAILIDADSGKTLFEKNADARKYPASTTKIMTCLLAVEAGNLNRKVTVPDSAGKAPADSTRMPVYPGEQMPFSDLLYGLMMKSGNDAANAVATLTSGSVSAFVEKMNARAKALDMENTHFVNAHGYPDADHYTTARDMARLTRAALRNADFSAIVRTRSHTLSATSLREKTTIQNGYAILDSSSEYHYPYAFGVKTGYSSASGQCFVGAAKKGGRTLISVVLKSGWNRPEKWIDTKALFEYGFEIVGA